MANRLVVNPTKGVLGLTDTKATLDTDATQGVNAALIFTSVLPGVQGNGIKVAQTVPPDNNVAVPLLVTASVKAKTITIRLGVSSDGSTIVSTGDDIKAAVAANPEASRLVTVADKAANDGSGLASAFASTALTGGLLDDVGPEEARVINVTSGEADTLVAAGCAVLPAGLSYEAKRNLARILRYSKEN